MQLRSAGAGSGPDTAGDGDGCCRWDPLKECQRSLVADLGGSQATRLLALEYPPGTVLRNPPRHWTGTSELSLMFVQVATNERSTANKQQYPAVAHFHRTPRRGDQLTPDLITLQTASSSEPRLTDNSRKRRQDGFQQPRLEREPVRRE